MYFQLNKEQQMAINDALLSLTERETKHLKDSWAETLKKNPLEHTLIRNTVVIVPYVKIVW